MAKKDNPDLIIINKVVSGIPTEEELNRFILLMDDPYWLELYMLKSKLKCYEDELKRRWKKL